MNVHFWKKERKIVTHPSAEITPQIVLARSLDKAKKMRGVIVVIQWDDHTVDCDWSNMRLSDLCFLERRFHQEVEAVFHEGDHEVEEPSAS